MPILNTFFRWAWPVGFFAALLALARFPAVFGALTGALAFVLFSRLEQARGHHWRAFYWQAPGASPAWPPRWLQVGAVLGRSAIIGLVTFLLFLGTDRSRLCVLALAFVAIVLLGVLMLSWIERRSGVQAERWGYLRLSAVLGVLFSVLILPAPGPNVWDLARDLTLSQTAGLDLAGTGELVHGVTSVLNAMIAEVLRGALGTVGGTLASMIISTNLIYGLPIAVYVFAYRRLGHARAGGGGRH